MGSERRGHLWWTSWTYSTADERDSEVKEMDASVGKILNRFRQIIIAFSGRTGMHRSSVW